MTWDKSDKAAVMFATAACGALAVYLFVSPVMVMSGVFGILSIPGRVLGINDPNSFFNLAPPRMGLSAPPAGGEYTWETAPRAPQAPSVPQAQTPGGSAMAPSAPAPKSAAEKQRDLFSTFSKIQQGTANGQP